MVKLSFIGGIRKDKTSSTVVIHNACLKERWLHIDWSVVGIADGLAAKWAESMYGTLWSAPVPNQSSHIGNGCAR